MRLIGVLAAAFVVALTACAPKPDGSRLAEARAVYQNLREYDFTAIEERLPDSMRNAQARAELQAMTRHLPDGGAAPGIELLRWQTASTSEGERTRFVDLYTYPDRVLEVTTELRRYGGKTQVLTFAIAPIDPALVARNRFKLSEAGFPQVMALAIMGLSGVAMLTAALSALFAKGLRFRWFWTALSLVGWGAGAANWTTGAISFNLAALALLRLGVTRGASPADPWLVNFSAPAGALIVLLFLAFRARPKAENEIKTQAPRRKAAA